MDDGCSIESGGYHLTAVGSLGVDEGPVGSVIASLYSPCLRHIILIVTSGAGHHGEVEVADLLACQVNLQVSHTFGGVVGPCLGSLVVITVNESSQVERRCVGREVAGVGVDESVAALGVFYHLIQLVSSLGNSLLEGLGYLCLFDSIPIRFLYLIQIPCRSIRPSCVPADDLARGTCTSGIALGMIADGVGSALELKLCLAPLLVEHDDLLGAVGGSLGGPYALRGVLAVGGSGHVGTGSIVLDGVVAACQLLNGEHLRSIGAVKGLPLEVVARSLYVESFLNALLLHEERSGIDDVVLAIGERINLGVSNDVILSLEVVDSLADRLAVIG